MPQFPPVIVDPRYRFDDEEGSTAHDDAASPFGARTLFHQGAPGLVGLNPIFLHDPRYPMAFSDLVNAIPRITGTGGRQIQTSFESNPRYLRDLDDKTLANDMYAIAAGHKGTSVGDQSSHFFMDLVKRAMQGGSYIGPEQVNFAKMLLRETNLPEFRQEHPTTSAYLYGKDR